MPGERDFDAGITHAAARTLIPEVSPRVDLLSTVSPIDCVRESLGHLESELRGGSLFDRVITEEMSKSSSALKDAQQSLVQVRIRWNRIQPGGIDEPVVKEELALAAEKVETLIVRKVSIEESAQIWLDRDGDKDDGFMRKRQHRNQVINTAAARILELFGELEKRIPGRATTEQVLEALTTLTGEIGEFDGQFTDEVVENLLVREALNEAADYLRIHINAPQIVTETLAILMQSRGGEQRLSKRDASRPTDLELAVGSFLSYFANVDRELANQFLTAQSSLRRDFLHVSNCGGAGAGVQTEAGNIVTILEMISELENRVGGLIYILPEELRDTDARFANILDWLRNPFAVITGALRSAAVQPGENLPSIMATQRMLVDQGLIPGGLTQNLHNAVSGVGDTELRNRLGEFALTFYLGISENQYLRTYISRIFMPLFRDIFPGIPDEIATGMLEAITR